MNSAYPYLEFIKISKECRDVLTEDTLNSNSPDLSDALYSNCQGMIYQVKLELYEIKWLELHWTKTSNVIESRNCSLSERKKLISMFAKWYNDFVSQWNYTEFDATIFEERMSILKALISADKNWENNLKQMKNYFIKSQKLLENKIKKLEGEANYGSSYSS